MYSRFVKALLNFYPHIPMFCTDQTPHSTVQKCTVLLTSTKCELKRRLWGDGAVLVKSTIFPPGQVKMSSVRRCTLEMSIRSLTAESNYKRRVCVLTGSFGSVRRPKEWANSFSPIRCHDVILQPTAHKIN